MIALLLLLHATSPDPAPPALLSPFDEAEGAARVWSAKAGGKVLVEVGRKTLALADGEPVKLIDDNGGFGMGADTVASIVARGKKATVPNDRVITEERLHRSPDERWAIFSALTSCGDFCHAAGWLLGAETRVLITKDDFGTDVVAAWRSDGTEVAVGSRALYLVSLPGGVVTRFDGFCAPAYDANDRLFVRSCGASDAVYEWVRGGKPRKILVAAGKPPESDPESPTDFGDPEPVEFAADGSLDAKFFRGDDYRVLSLRPEQISKGSSAPLPAPPEVTKAVATILDETVAPDRASSIATTQGNLTPAFARDLAIAANTRGHRLYQAGKLDDARRLFIAAAGLDITYGMPRYNLARVYARKGDAKESALYLHMLRRMGKPQRPRLEQARKDEAFHPIAGTPEFKAAFE